ncbi:hypothetical protein [Nostoc sp. FACHB-190]|uniref:hypothetical protein n=1 Tax=Nostoc sp. FACHB-190 TaxID=2692838 RepID=UPI001686A945|nr:hypothetical protein [Nostoc sp. FACHB-190]MBD2299305.1 hypothetical protein [Nostoc sp. FACHB-190]
MTLRLALQKLILLLIILQANRGELGRSPKNKHENDCCICIFIFSDLLLLLTFYPQFFRELRCRLGGGTEPNIYAYFVGLRDRYTQPTILLTNNFSGN